MSKSCSAPVPGGAAAPRASGWPAVHGRITVRGVVRAAARYYRMTPDALVHDRSSPAIARRRHVAMYLACALTGRGAGFIAYHMGGPSPGGIRYGVRAVKARLGVGHAGTAAAVAAIRRELADGAMSPAGRTFA